MTGAARAHLHLRMTIAPLNGKTMKQLEALSGVPYPTLARQMSGCQANGKCGQLDEKGRPYARIQGDLVAGLAEGLNMSLDAIAYRVNADGQDTRRTEPAVKKEKGHDTPAPKGRKAKPAAASPPEEPKTEKPPVKTLPEGPKSKKSPEIDKGAWFAKRKKDPEPHGKHAAGGEWDRRKKHDPEPEGHNELWAEWEYRRLTNLNKEITLKRATLAADLRAGVECADAPKKIRQQRVEQIVQRLMAGKKVPPWEM